MTKKVDIRDVRKAMVELLIELAIAIKLNSRSIEYVLYPYEYREDIENRLGRRIDKAWYGIGQTIQQRAEIEPLRIVDRIKIDIGDWVIGDPLNTTVFQILWKYGRKYPFLDFKFGLKSIVISVSTEYGGLDAASCSLRFFIRTQALKGTEVSF